VSYTLTLTNAKTARPTLANVIVQERGEALLLVYRPGVSSRGVEVSFEDDDVHTRLTALAAPGDWALAFEYLAACAGEAAPVVTGEDGTSGTSDAFADVIARETAGALAGAESALANNPGSEISLRGPVREVHVGARLLGELVEPRVMGLIERVRRLQYLESEGYELCAPISLRAPGVPTFTVWSPDRAQAFEPVEALGLSAPGGNLYIPVAALPGLLGDRFQWLDEKQFAIAAGDDPGLVERARPLSIDPYKAVKKKWWQFWRRDD
jgi:hypothetical protein